MKLVAWMLLLVLLAGCGRATEAAKADPVVSKPKSDLSTKIALRARWAMHLDAARLRGTAAIETYRAVAAAPPLSQLWSRYGAGCTRLVDSLEDVVVSGRESGSVLAATMIAPVEQALGCVREAEKATPVTFHARPAFEFEHGDKVVLAIDDVLLVGDRTLVGELVELAFGPAAPTPTGTGLVLGADEVFSLRLVATGMVRSVEASLSAVPKERGEAVTFSAKVETHDEHSAREIASALEPLRVQAESTKLVEVVLSAVPHATIRVASAKDASVAARAVGAVSIALGSALLRLDKTTEARATIEGIAHRLAASVAEPTSGRRLPASMGPVPASVPTAQRFDLPVSPAGWARLEGVLPRRTFYQFEVTTTPDAKHAVVHARGDLNGDGKLSHFTIPVDVTPAGYAVVGALSITDALE